MGKRYDDEVKQTAIRMRRQNMPVKQICAELGISLNALHCWCNEAGLVRHHPGKVRSPAVTHRRQADRSTHVMGGVQHGGLPDEMMSALRGEVPTCTRREDPIIDRRVRQLVASGELLEAAAILDDATPDHWSTFGEMVCPDFLRPWQCGRLLFYLACGVHRGVALARVGVPIGEYEEWLAHAANRKEPWRTLVALCGSAQASACARMQDEINSKQPGWQAVAWSLEKISPEIYARHVSDDEIMRDGAFADVGDENLKRAALAYIVEDNDHSAAEAEHVDLDDLLERREQ